MAAAASMPTQQILSRTPNVALRARLIGHNEALKALVTLRVGCFMLRNDLVALIMPDLVWLTAGSVTGLIGLCEFIFIWLFDESWRLLLHGFGPLLMGGQACRQAGTRLLLRSYCTEVCVDFDGFTDSLRTTHERENRANLCDLWLRKTIICWTC